jgi:4-hydroxybenzoate polyprenyltransferase
LAAVAMVVQTFFVLHLSISAVFCVHVFCLVFLGYNFYFLLSATQKRNWISIWKQRHLRWRIISTILALLIFIVTLTQIRVRIETWFLLVLGFLIYFLLKSRKNQKHLYRFGWIKTVWLSVIWVFVTFYFPGSFAGVSFDYSEGMMMLQRFSFIFLISLFNDLRDVEKDLLFGRKTLATQLHGNRWIWFTAFFLVLSIGLMGWMNVDGIFSALDTWVSIFALVGVGIFIFNHKRIENRLVYLILGDGMMILYTGLLFVERISLLC